MSANLTPMTWSDYVRQAIGADQQVDAARKAHVDQTTISRWIRGGQAGRAENVVKFARAYGRPVLEALVIAGFITESEAKARVSITQVQDPSDEELLALIARRLRRSGEEAQGGDTAPMSVLDVGLAARTGEPAHGANLIPDPAPDAPTDDELA